MNKKDSLKQFREIEKKTVEKISEGKPVSIDFFNQFEKIRLDIQKRLNLESFDWYDFFEIMPKTLKKMIEEYPDIIFNIIKELKK